jgi:hypothetical protein
VKRIAAKLASDHAKNREEERALAQKLNISLAPAPSDTAAVPADLQGKTGRDFDSRDVEGAPPVIIVNRTVMQRFFNNENPVGQMVHLDGRMDQPPQKIVNDANLTGSAFTQFVTLFPQLSGVVQEATTNVAVALRSLTDIANAQQSAQDRLFAGTNDTSTLAGALAAYDRRAEQERAAEIAAGGQAINDLVAAQEAERLKIINDFNAQALAAQKQAADSQLQIFRGIRDYLEGLKIGALSTLSPLQQLAAAQSNYNAQLALAQGGDQAALGNGGGDVALAGGEFVMPAAQTRANLPQLEAMRSGSSNDNAISSLGQQLVRAMAGVSVAEMNNLRESHARLEAKFDALIRAVQGNKPPPPRPGSETKAKAA